MIGHNKVYARMSTMSLILRNKLFLTLLLLVAFPLVAFPQSDPLNPAYLPSIDTNSSDYPGNIWITDTMQKVRQDSGSPGTQHWGTFYGTQNEFVDFQVHAQAGSSGIPNLSFTTSDFVNSHTGTHILASSTNIIVYREAYIDVASHVTSTASTYYNSLGYYPDALIPTVDPYHGQTTNAWPFSVAANQNQSAWIDVHVPANAPAGYYLGTITATSSGTTLAKMPVIIAVWQWPNNGSMPSTSSLPSWSGIVWDSMCILAYGNYSACGAYPGSGGSADTGVTLSIVDFGTMMLDHRFATASPVYPPYTTSFTGLETTYGPLFNGTANTILSGARLTTAAYAPGSLSYIQNWMTEFQSKHWLPNTLFNYTCDEPPAGCAWSSINPIAAALHATNPPMPSLVTANIANATSNGVLNGIDIMVTIINDLDPQGGSLQRSAYNAWLSGSAGPQRLLWSYQSCESAGTCSNGYVGGNNATWPNYDIDGKPSANRSMEWMTFYHNQSGELYYNTTGCWIGNSCGVVPSDPWVGQYNFGGWGDGNLVYDGIPSKVGSGVAIPIWVPSIRLKQIRDGMQDYEYLTVLTNAGQNSFVTNQINSWITNSYTFETSGAGLQNARLALGTALHRLTYGVLLQPPTNLRATVE